MVYAPCAKSQRRLHTFVVGDILRDRSGVMYNNY